MSNHTGHTYSFSTFQELVDRVPADRIPECMEELGIMLGAAKAYAELAYDVALDLAKEDGTAVDPGHPKSFIQIPNAMEWIDDGKGELEPRFQGSNGNEIARLKIVRRKKP